MWGRAEGVRTLIRTVFEAAAPLSFGLLSGVLGGTGAVPTGGSRAADTVGPQNRVPLARTFLIMLVPTVVDGVLLIVVARRSYPGDVATALALDDDAFGSAVAHGP